MELPKGESVLGSAVRPIVIHRADVIIRATSRRRSRSVHVGGQQAIPDVIHRAGRGQEGDYLRVWVACYHLGAVARIGPDALEGATRACELARAYIVSVRPYAVLRIVGEVCACCE